VAQRCASQKQLLDCFASLAMTELTV